MKITITRDGEKIVIAADGSEIEILTSLAHAMGTFLQKAKEPKLIKAAADLLKKQAINTALHPDARDFSITFPKGSEGK